MNKVKNLWLGVVGIFMMLFANLHAAVPTEIEAISSDATTVFTAIKTLVVAVVAFFILIKVVKWIRK